MSGFHVHQKGSLFPTFHSSSSFMAENIPSDDDFEVSTTTAGKRKEEKEKEEHETKRKKVGGADNDIATFELGNKRRATVRTFKGRTLIDLREYYDDGGTLKPGRKGIALTLDQWKKLKEFVDAIDKAVA